MIDRTWRRLGPGLEPLSAPDGGPLSRTVKLVLLPLVLRPSLHRELAAAVLDDSGVAMVEQLVEEHRQPLRGTAAWFTLLVRHLADHPSKDQVSRDACYPKAFELAVHHGDPGHDADATAVDALDEIAETRGEWTSTTLRHALDDPKLRSRLSARLVSGWAEALAPDLTVDELFENDCLTFLDSVDITSDHDQRQAEQAWTTIVDAGVGSQTGRGLHADRWPTVLPGPARARQLGLTELGRPARPALDGGAEARCPWDRSIAARVRGVLQHSGDRTVLPDLVDLLTDEVDRACAPWQVLEETSRATLVVGTVLVTGLPGPGDPHRAGGTRAHRTVVGMCRRESWLTWAQRQPTAWPGPPTTGPADLVAAYLRRLWVRLHGAETRGALPAGVEETQSLLLGVFRSVLLDGRSRVRTALTRLHAATSGGGVLPGQHGTDDQADDGPAGAPDGASR